MGNIRIKDIATTAASTASDDFIAIDGATNGTRKLSAYSPTIGGNLTVSSTTDSSSTTTGCLVLGGGIGMGGNINSNGRGNFNLGLRVGSSYSAVDVATGSSGLYLSGAQGATDHVVINNAGQMQVLKTTASTSTTTGALVVSGGVGVADQGWFGNYVTVDGTSGAAFRARKSNNTSGFQSWSSSLDASGTWSFQCSNDNFVGANTAITLTRSGTTPTGLTVNSTTASTSTTTGALVVSGGVGVAGAGYFGGNINIGGNYLYVGGTSNFYLRATGSDNGIFRSAVLSVDTSAWFGVRDSTGSNTYFKVDATTSQTQVLSTTASTSTTTGALVVSGGVGVAGDVNVGGVIIHKSYTVAGLPAAAAGNTYGIVFVSDATNAAGTGIGTAPTGGGAVKRAVYSTGSAWLLL
jgi:multimeric flavodoxin WrbA